MESQRRTLRSNMSAARHPSTPPTPLKSPVIFSTPQDLSISSDVQIYSLGSKLAGLMPAELSLLRRKQKKLAKSAPSIALSLPPGPYCLRALESSLIFAQDAAGSAVCIDPTGWVLTCSHCFSESEEDFQADSKRRWLLYYTGLAVQIECRFWDGKRDLALAKIIAVESAGSRGFGQVPTFQYVRLSSSSPIVGTSIICVGQPGSEDLESATVRKTKYDLVEISEGYFRGLVPKVDPQDNSTIGALMHDAWTYWGHSGAPLLDLADGSLLGLHSSWDSETAMRHGVPHVAIQRFLQQNLPLTLGSQVDHSEATSESSLLKATNTASHHVGNITVTRKSEDDLSGGRPKKVNRHSVIIIDDDE